MFSGLTVQRSLLIRNIAPLSNVRDPMRVQQVVQVYRVFLRRDHQMTSACLPARTPIVAAYAMLNLPWKTIIHHRTMKQL